MTNIKFIGIVFNNDYWNTLGTEFVKNFEKFINIKKCSELGLVEFFEYECHCTLMYNDSYMYGPNYTYVNLKVNRDLSYLLKSIKDKNELIINDLIIDTFDNEDSRVLKINLSNCNLISELTKIHDYLMNDCENSGNYVNYNPHLTLTYLNPDVSDSDINNMKSWIINSFKDKLLNYKISTILMSNLDKGEEFKKVINF